MTALERLRELRFSQKPLLEALTELPKAPYTPPSVSFGSGLSRGILENHAATDDRRHCAACKEPFTGIRPPVEPVTLREGQPGYTVPRLRITLTGSLCAACARGKRRRAA